MPLHHSRLLLATLLLALVGCERACGEAHEMTEKIGDRLIPVELEQRLGARMATRFRQDVTLVQDPAVEAYIDELGGALAGAATGVPDGMTFEFAVVRAPDTVNAIAMPGGFIYVYSGLLHAVDSEAELAGVLAHEVAHVAERHVVAQLVTSMGIQTLRSLALGEEGGELARIVTELTARGALGAYSRTAEREADELGVRTLARAGWDPGAYAAFFDELSATREGSGMLARFASSHPDPGERARRVRELAAELDVEPTRTGSASLRDITARLER